MSSPELIDAAEGGRRVAAGAFLVDVRSAPTRERVGAIVGAAVVDRTRLPELFDAGSPERLPGLGDATTPVVVVCGSVDGSRPVADWLAEHGWPNVAHVDGGFAAWKAAGGAITAGTETEADPSCSIAP